MNRMTTNGDVGGQCADNLLVRDDCLGLDHMASVHGQAMMVDKITRGMWRRALGDQEEAYDLLVSMEVLGPNGLTPLTHIDVSNKGAIRITEATLEECHHIICMMCPEWAKDS